MGKPVAYSELKYDDSMIIDVENMSVAAGMLDKLARLKDVRRRQPLDMTDNIFYDHRYLYDEYNLQIGDSCFMIPPEFIMVTSESPTQVINTLRQENSQKMKSGYHKRTILIDLVFNGMNQLNGYPVEGPEGIYYVDGLRSILAQFKCTPFLPIISEFINGTYGIFTVALQSITISTVNGFPNVMKAQLTLQEVNLVPYLEVPNFMYRYMIDWDLFRFYYQRFLTEEHEYKKLQSLPTNKEHNHFRISILNPSVFDNIKVTDANFLDIITDKKIVSHDDDGHEVDSNFLTYVDSRVDDAIINEFQCGYSNMLANIQMSESECPTVQFMGGMDTIYNISFETKDKSVVQAIEQCQVINDLITRNNIKLRSLGFVKLESELVEFTGSLFVMIDSVTTNTVPGFPDLYNVQINCVSFDIAQSSREELNGFMPFECNQKHPHGGHADQAIEQSWEGVETKAKQDNYAEWKIRTTMEVYPDMHLPTYKEVNEFVGKCIEFRAKHNLDSLPYSQYPMKPFSMLFGNNPNNTISVNADIFYASEISTKLVEYNIFVDPDFYVFYFNPYGDEKYDYTIEQRSEVSKTHTVTIKQGDDFVGYGGTLIERMIQVAKSKLDCPYSWGGDGENQYGRKGNQLAFDCSGFITYILKQVGLYSGEKLGVTGIVNEIRNGRLKQYFEEVPWESRQRGDIVCFGSNGDYSHTGLIVAEGQGKDMIHAGGSHDGTSKLGSRRGPNDKVKYGDSAYDNRGKICFRLRPQYRNGNSTGGASITTSGSDNEQKIWSGLKSAGLSDIAVASIMGNMMAECGLDPNKYEKDNNIWSGSKIPYNKGYGLIQWTNTNAEGTGVGRRDKFMNYFNNNPSQYSTIENQLKYLIYECTEGPDSGYYGKWWNKTSSASSLEDGVSAFLQGIEGLSKNSKYWPGSYSKRLKYAQEIYNRNKGQSSFGDSSDGPTEVQPDDVLLQSQYDQICRVVMATTEGEGSEAEKACAQVIYDMLTDPQKSFGDLSNILSNSARFEPPDESKEITSSVLQNCDNVFKNGIKKWNDKVALDLVNTDASEGNIPATLKDRKAKWPADLGDVAQHHYFGRNGKGSDTRFTVVPDGQYKSSSTVTTTTVENTVAHKRIGLDMSNIKYFGEPVIARTSKMTKDGNARFVRDELNHGIRRYNSAFCDMYQYSARGTLLRGFPAFLFCILDDQSQWYDGRKLWTNYYVYKSVVDIQVHAANDMPIENATITITNSYHNLDQTQMGLSKYNVANDPRYDSPLDIRKNIYKMTGLMLGGLELTPTLMELHQIIYSHARLREGARIHLRMGYGSDPLSLAPVINGHISDITLGDQITMVVTSDGNELINHVTSSKEKDTNNGVLGLFGLFEDQESSNIIANIMCERQSWVNRLQIIGGNKWFEGSKYGIEHYGIFCNEGFGDVINKKDQYDLLKNLYIANYDKESYVLGVLSYWDDPWEFITNLFGGDGEKNVVFNQYNMTPWDVFQTCTQQVPEYIFKSSYHQFDSRIYFGLPFWMEKCRYDWYNRDGSTELYEECKSASQVFYCDSITNIIDNQIRVTSKYSNTNVKVMYTLGGTTKSTDLLRSDSTIDFAYQKTAIIDSPIVQDCLGPDSFYKLLGIQRTGIDSATRIGCSNLIYGWQQQYQGGLILNGTPGIKPYDHIILNDTFANTYGICFAREVIHSFSTMTGYTTTVVPGMIAVSTMQNSGNIEQFQNYLMLLNAFAYMTAYRKSILDNYQQNMSVISNLIIMQDKLDNAIARYKTAHNVELGFNALTVFGKGLILYKALGSIEGIKNIINTAKGAYATFKALKTVGSFVNGITATFNAIKSGAAVTGWGIVISVVVQVVEILVRDLLLWIEYQNMVCLLPLWWENYPFVSGVKDGQKILLMDSNANASEETKKEVDTEITRFD